MEEKGQPVENGFEEMVYGEQLRLPLEEMQPCRERGELPESIGAGGPVTLENLWQVIAACQGKVFYTAKKLPFSYAVKGGELFTDRRERSITRSTFEKAYTKIKEADGKITGPKKLNMYGAPYVWAVLKGIGAV